MSTEIQAEMALEWDLLWASVLAKVSHRALVVGWAAAEALVPGTRLRQEKTRIVRGRRPRTDLCPTF